MNCPKVGQLWYFEEDDRIFYIVNILLEKLNGNEYEYLQLEDEKVYYLSGRLTIADTNTYVGKRPYSSFWKQVDQ